MTPPRRVSSWRGSLMVAVAAAGWGTWPFFLRHAERANPIPASLEALAPVLGLTVSSVFLLGRDRLKVRATPADWRKIVFYGATDALNVVFFFAAYQRTSIAIAVLTHYLTPMLVAIGAPAAGLEPFRRRTWVSVLVSFAGLVLLLAPWSAARHPGDLSGAAFGLASAACYAANVLVSKSLVPVFSASEMAVYHGVISIVLLGALVPLAAWGELGLPAASWLAAGAILPGALCGLLFLWGLRRVHASQASNLTLLEPLVATVAASVVFHEPLGFAGLVGGGLILGGAALVVAVGKESRSVGSGSRVGGGLRLY